MSRVPSFACFLLSACLMMTGCKTSVNLKPTGTVPVTLTSEKKSTAVKASLQNLVVITLERPDADHAWQISFHDTRFLKQMSELKAGATPESGPTVSFLTLHGGRTPLRFLLLPAAAGRDAAPADQQELILTIE